MRCRACNGTGEKSGLGMMMVDCHCIDTSPVIKAVSDRIDKRSRAYRGAVADIMSSCDVGRIEAAKIFEEEFSKIG